VGTVQNHVTSGRQARSQRLSSRNNSAQRVHLTDMGVNTNSFQWARTPLEQRLQQLLHPAHPRALTIPAAARYISSSVKFIRQLIWSRQIKYVKVGRRFVIAREELDRWVTENQRHA
jgi:excisionase family DNA binding protein